MFLLALTTLVLPSLQASAQDLSPEALRLRMVERRAVDAVIWGLPLVGEDTVKQAAFRDGKANYNDIVWWPKGSWKNQSPTPNVNTRYMYFFTNTKQDGPVVVELPPAVPGASFYGTIEDSWYVPLTDIGLEGKGGKYLVLPPDYKDAEPDGYTLVRPKTYNTMTLLRSILASASEKDVQAGDELVKGVLHLPEMQEMVRRVEATGMIDFYVIASGNNMEKFARIDHWPPTPAPHNLHARLAAGIREVTKRPVAALARIVDPREADQ